MADHDHDDTTDTPTGERIGSQSGGSTPAGKEGAADPLRDPSAAGADRYNSGNKTGNPVKSGTAGTPEKGEGVNAHKGTPVHESDD